MNALQTGNEELLEKRKSECFKMYEHLSHKADDGYSISTSEYCMAPGDIEL